MSRDIRFQVMFTESVVLYRDIPVLRFQVRSLDPPRIQINRGPVVTLDAKDLFASLDRAFRQAGYSFRKKQVAGVNPLLAAAWAEDSSLSVEKPIFLDVAGGFAKDVVLAAVKDGIIFPAKDESIVTYARSLLGRNQLRNDRYQCDSKVADGEGRINIDGKDQRFSYHLSRKDGLTLTADGVKIHGDRVPMRTRACEWLDLPDPKIENAEIGESDYFNRKRDAFVHIYSGTFKKIIEQCEWIRKAYAEVRRTFDLRCPLRFEDIRDVTTAKRLCAQMEKLAVYDSYDFKACTGQNCSTYDIKLSQDADLGTIYNLQDKNGRLSVLQKTEIPKINEKIAADLLQAKRFEFKTPYEPNPFPDDMFVNGVYADLPVTTKNELLKLFPQRMRLIGEMYRLLGQTKPKSFIPSDSRVPTRSATSGTLQDIGRVLSGLLDVCDDEGRRGEVDNLGIHLDPKSDAAVSNH